MLDQ
jgi:hypothetical protein